MERAVFLDRDNTIIHNDGDLGDPQQVRLIKGAASAIASLRGLGYHVVVVSNQGGVARGAFTEEDVERVNSRIASLVWEQAGASIDRFYYCPHHPEAKVERYRGDHPWRKPRPGMLEQAAADLELELSRCWMVGDQPRDIAAGRAVGARTVLLAHPESGLVAEPEDSQGEADFVASNLVEAVRIIAQQQGPQQRAEEAARVEREPAREDAGEEAPAPAGASAAVEETVEPVAAEAAEEERGAHASGAEDRPEPPAEPTEELAAHGAAFAESASSEKRGGHAAGAGDGPGDTDPDEPDDARDEARGAASDDADPAGPEDPADAERSEEETEEQQASPAWEVPEVTGASAGDPQASFGVREEEEEERPRRSGRAEEGGETAEAEALTEPVGAVEGEIAGQPGGERKRSRRKRQWEEEGQPQGSADPQRRTVELLEQIQREIKAHRAAYQDFSWPKMLAAVFQMLTIACVVFALMNLAEPSFYRWSLGAILGQLLVITMLNLHNQR